MGAHPYCYFTPHQADIAMVLRKLQEEELQAGRYEPCFQARTGTYLFELAIEPRDQAPAPGGQHATVEQAQSAMDESGSYSILDITNVRHTPFTDDDDFMQRMSVMAPVDEDLVEEIFGTRTPARDDVVNALLGEMSVCGEDFWEEIERGQASYIVVHKDGSPSEVFIGGMSFD